MITWCWNVRDVTTPEPPRNPWRQLSLNQQRLVGGVLGLTVALTFIALNSNDDSPYDPTISGISAASSPAGVALDVDRCGTNRDVLVRTVAPEMEASATILGSYDVRTCQSTFDDLKATSLDEAGYCTEAAYASDNPGYDEAARPAPPLTGVVVAIGPAC